MKKFPLQQENTFREEESNIWSMDISKNIAYSDGRESEARLKAILKDAFDLSSSSMELSSHIEDTATEYHLSPQRSNLIGALNLEGMKNILELGCGCGAITRYIAESGAEVDAVEGNVHRAEIARMRCRDLANVNIVHADFNQLSFPPHTYDAVFLIGILEYAKKFGPQSTSDMECAAKILKKVHSAVTKNGIIITAIENRMGLKYWLGASEDHFGEPYIGLYDYPHDHGVRTYDRKEWEEIFRIAGVRHHCFLYPFPDYKLPKAILSGEYIRNDKYAHSILQQIHSRDYTKKWQTDSQEFLLWRSLHQKGTLEEYANSFLIVMSDSVESIRKHTPYDFIYFSDPGRKLHFQTRTMKERGRGMIQKERVTPLISFSHTRKFQQNVSESEYISGSLLSAFWLLSIVGTTDLSRFEQLLATYYGFLRTCLKNPENIKTAIDYLPFNIIIDENNSYRVIDQEWRAEKDISAEFILFRSLLWFGHHHKKLLHPLCIRKNIKTVFEFIEYGFQLLSLPIETHIDEFRKLEEEFQETVILNKEKNSISGMLVELLQKPDDPDGSDQFPVQIFWDRQGDGFCEQDSKTILASIGSKQQKLVFEFPGTVTKIKRIRFDPCDRPGFFQLFSVTLLWKPGDCPSANVIWRLESIKSIREHSATSDIESFIDDLGETFCSTSTDPQLVFDTPFGVRSPEGNGAFLFEVEMDWPKSKEYEIARSNCIKEVDIKRLQLQNREKQIQTLQHELRMIEDSITWQIAKRVRGLAGALTFGKLPILKKGILTLKKQGLIAFYEKTRIYCLRQWKGLNGTALSEIDYRWLNGPQKTAYDRWITANEPDKKELNSQTTISRTFVHKPLISIVVPVFNTHKNMLRQMIQSVENQSYPNWELCISDGASRFDHVRQMLQDYSKQDNRIRYTFLPENLGISGNTNAAIRIAQGDFIAFLDHDDTLAPFALFEIVRQLNKKPHTELFYSDEDKITSTGRYRFFHHFKPEWNREFFRSYNYMAHFLVVKKTLLETTGYLRSDFDGAQDYDLILRATEKTDKIHHIPKILYHWRVSENSTALNAETKPYAYNAGQKALSEHLCRIGTKGEVLIPRLGIYRIQYEIPDPPPAVSIIIPEIQSQKGFVRFLQSLAKTDYPGFEILVGVAATGNEAIHWKSDMERNMNIRSIEIKRDKTTAAGCNAIVRHAVGDLLLFVNPCAECIHEDWIRPMAGHCCRDDKTGAAGAMLYGENNTIHNAGIMLGVDGIYGYPHRGEEKDSMGYAGRLLITQNVSAVSADCLMVRKELFARVNGFDENYQQECHDVDLCLSLQKSGYQNVWTPFSRLKVYPAPAAENMEDRTYFQNKWRKEIDQGDPCYNPNFLKKSTLFRLA
ncbi:MAG: glycosyltransferase [Desulfobacteraceae bacterium]|nr:MAG: glycosyltransferase [Desulfobacteraceae bacterium]